MKPQFLIIISLVLIIYFGLHALLFLLLKGFFFPRNRAAQLWLALILFLLAASFILAFIGIHQTPYPWLRRFYTGGAVWLGSLVNLLLIFGLGRFVFFLLNRFLGKGGPFTFGAALLAFAVLYTAFGLYHAGQIRARSIHLSLPNLPDPLKGKTIAHVSDLHLGVTNGEKLSRKIVELIEGRKVEAVAITGDLLDGLGDDLHHALAPFDRLSVPIFYVTGNHETYLGLEKAMAVLSRTRIRILRDEIVEWRGLQWVGVDFPERGMKKDLRPLLSRLDPSKPAILLYHEPAQVETAAAYGVALQLSGHTHKGQILPMRILARLVYKKYDHGLHRIGNYALYTTSGAGTWGPPMRIGSTAEVVFFTLQ